MTVAFRILLALPHSIMVGPVVWFYRTGSFGLLGAAAGFLAVVNWVSLVITGKAVAGIRDFTLYYLRWRTRAVAYTALFVDEYPPFGDAPYPASFEIAPATEPRDRTSIALRLLFALPHVVALFFVTLAWCVTSIVAWFVILFGGTYPAGLYQFGLGAMRWLMRVEAYVLLLVDEYPPFTLDA
jgi:hypothetical protein